ncbi:MAG: NAD(+) diphosphatase [Bacteroides sp.]|jgi:NAD+ diphosphatase|nr:NAD(+) diphosphatase [Bacteroides sp.]MCI1682011.1 NAD(+) diphosphatase [Bacteroides sp.]
METVTKSIPTQWYIFFEDQLLLKKRTIAKSDSNIVSYSVPYSTEAPVGGLNGNIVHEVSLPDGRVINTVSVNQLIADTDDWTMMNLRASYEHINHKEYAAAGKAYQILYWDKHSRYCPVCGTPTKQQTPIMKKCPSCGFEIYPPVATAVIVLIRREDKILLVHARNFRGTFYGLVAGFLEAGETLEQCVEREVMEETGLRIKNITYFDNQPWPYPSGLMVGFIADYESGDIKLQEDELSAAEFYDRNNLPEIPRKLSLARKLIDWWLEHC